MSFLAERCPWYLAGLCLGVCIVGLRWAANLHLGATGSFAGVEAWARRPTDGPGWRVFFFVGLIVGGAIYALASGGAHATMALPSFEARFGGALATKAAILGGAGALMGFGARVAGGCTSGHGICGTAQGSPASFAATMTFMATAIGVAQLSWLLWPVVA
jgi:hypothetical protein